MSLTIPVASFFLITPARITFPVPRLQSKSHTQAQIGYGRRKPGAAVVIVRHCGLPHRVADYMRLVPTRLVEAIEHRQDILNIFGIGVRIVKGIEQRAVWGPSCFSKSSTLSNSASAFSLSFS